MSISLTFLALCLVGVHASTETDTQNSATVVVVVGAAGEPEMGKRFEQWAGLWTNACEKAGAHHLEIGLGPTNDVADLDKLKQTIEAQPKESGDDLWLVFLGHGTFDGQDAKFNLRGPDVSATNLATWLQPFKRPLVIIDCSSASAPFLNKLSAPSRVVITSTRSGYEQNYARFGQYISEAIGDPQADLDKDGQVSLLEAFLTASRRVAEFYQVEGRLATEHPLLDDNGDGLGTPADWFRGIRAVKKPRENASLDGLRAHQCLLIRSEEERKLSPEKRHQRDELESSIAKLREKKSQLAEDEYYRQIEVLMVQMARLNE